MMFALVAIEEGFEVWVADIDEPENDVRMNTPEEIEDAEGHLFVIRKAAS